MEVKVLELSNWVTPASHYKIRQVGDFRIGKHTFQRGYRSYHGMDGYALFYVKYPFETTTLLQQKPQRLSWREWMVDSPTDYRAMQKYAQQAYGKVLTCGLGLGLVTQELLNNPLVQDITVVEISPHVIELISGYLPADKRIRIVNQDFWRFIEQDNSHWDTMIIDLWVFWGEEQQIALYRNEVYPANERLKRKYPGTRIFFHGFAGMPRLEKIDQALEVGEDVDPLIYGLATNDTKQEVLNATA